MKNLLNKLGVVSKLNPFQNTFEPFMAIIAVGMLILILCMLFR